MRVTFVVPEGNVSGAETVLLELVRARPAAELTALCPPGSPVAALLAAEGVPVAPFSLVKRSETRSWGGLAARVASAGVSAWRGVRLHDADVVHVFLPLALKATAVPARLAGRPVVLTVHDVLTPAAIGALRASVQRRLTTATVAEVITVSDYVRRSLVDAGYPADRLTTVHNGIDPRRVLASASTGARRRRELGIDADATVFGIFGRLTDWKGHAVAIEALRRLATSGADAHLVVVGSPFHHADHAHADGLRAQVAAAGLGGAVHFVPATADVASYYAAVDAVLVPSTAPDPFPTVALEAGAAGRPAVVTALGGAREAVLDGFTGLVRDPDPAAFAPAMAALLDPAVRLRLGAAARARIETAFSAGRYATEVASVWERAA